MSPTPAPLLAELPPRDFTARLRRRTLGVGARQARRTFAGRALGLLAVCAVPALAAPQDWRQHWAVFEIGDAGAAEVTVEPQPFERPGESFPGSAFYYLAPETAAVSQPLDGGAHWDGEALAGPAARALHAAGTALDRARALTCLTQAIYYEAASEPDAGQRAVAQVVLNRVAHPAYPKTVCGVVYQGSERPTGCQFTFTCDGALARVPNRLFWIRAESVARSALAGYVYAPVGLATHYHTIAVHPYWADTLAFIGAIGAHRFYRLGGPAGAPATFNIAAYRGGEPAAAPLPRATGPAAPDPALDPLAIERAFARGYAAAAQPLASGANPTGAAPNGTMAPAATHAAPTYAPDLQARGGDRLYTGRALPEANGVRPEYARSGEWIARPGT